MTNNINLCAKKKCVPSKNAIIYGTHELFPCDIKESSILSPATVQITKDKLLDPVN